MAKKRDVTSTVTPSDFVPNETLTEAVQTTSGIATTPDAHASELEFRDAMAVNGALSDTAIMGLDGEVAAQQQALEQDTLATLETMRGLEAGDRVRWRITRTGHEDEKWNGYLDTWPNHHCTLERIKRVFGGGTYYCMGFRNGKYWTHKTVSVAGEAILMPGQKPSELPHNGGSASDFRMLLAQQDQREAQRLAREEERRERERRERDERDERERKNRNELLALVLPAVTGLSTAIVGAFANRGSQMADIAALMTAMKGPDPMTVLTQLKALEKSNDNGVLAKLLPNLLELATSRASGGDSGWIDVVKELAKSAGPAVGLVIEGAVSQAQQRALAAQPGAVPAGAPAALSAPAAVSVSVPAAPMIVVPESVRRRERVPIAPRVAVPVPMEAVNDMSLMNLMMPLLPHQGWLTNKLQQFGWAAERKKDPELYAAIFLEEFPDGVDVQIAAQLLSRSDWYTLLCQFEPRLQREDFVPWFTALRDHIVHSIQSETGVVAGVQSPAQRTVTGQQNVEVRGPASAADLIPAQDPGVASVPVSRPIIKTEPGKPTQIPDLYGQVKE